MAIPATPASGPIASMPEHPPGFRLRRGRNWFFLGLTYASYYLCRLNLGIVAPHFKAALGFDNTQYGDITTARNWAYGVGQFVNGLFTDRLGGKQAMTIGAGGTIIFNILFGLTAWSNIGYLFFALLIIRMADGYVQAFGSPGMVKINTAWFRRQERGAFAGIFGFMINLGASGVGYLAPLLARGFAVPLLFFTLIVPKLDWRYMFIVPPIIIGVIVVLMNLTVKNHPEEAGFRIQHDDEAADDDPHARIHLWEVFRKITSNPIVWIVAGAYFCTGYVRSAIYEWYSIYLGEVWDVHMVGSGSSLFWWLSTILLPILASVGSLGSGVISDKLFKGRRAPVAAVLYLTQAVITILAILLSEGRIYSSVYLAVTLVLGIHVACNATHSILGTAAAMDLGGRKMAGFASGVIDSFQYFGQGVAGMSLGRLLDHFGRPATGAALASLAPSSQPHTVINPTVWFLAMLPWGVLGAGLMTYLWLRHRGSNAPGT